MYKTSVFARGAGKGTILQSAPSHFVPQSNEEHRKGNLGHDVPDYCLNCNQPFMGHTNGECPKGGR